MATQTLDNSKQIISYSHKVKRLPYIDNIKGFGMILVVLGHVINAYSTEDSYNNNVFMDFVSIFYMKMFFYFSGFVYVFKNIKSKDFILDSFKALIWPCLMIWGGNMLGIMIIRIIHGESPLFVLPKSEYINFYWFCKCLFLSRIVLFLTCKLFEQNNKSVICVLLSNIFFVLILYLPIGVDIPWGFKTIHLYYVLGYVIKSHNILDAKKQSILFASAVLLVVLCILRYSINSYPLVHKLTFVVLPVPIIVLIYYIFKGFLNEVLFLTEIGRKSLMIYLLHLCILSLFYHILDYYFDRSLMYNFVSWMIVFTFLLFASYQGAKYILKNRVCTKILFLQNNHGEK